LEFKVTKIYITILETLGQHPSFFCEFSLHGDQKGAVPLIERIFVKNYI
jgi:hypothetical protein